MYLFLRYYSESDESTYSIRKMAIMFWKCLESNHKMQCRSGMPGKINISFFNLWCTIVNLAATTKSEDFSFLLFLQIAMKSRWKKKIIENLHAHFICIFKEIFEIHICQIILFLIILLKLILKLCRCARMLTITRFESVDATNRDIDLKTLENDDIFVIGSRRNQP